MYYDETQQNKKMFATCISDEPKYNKKWIFLFHRQLTVYWQKQKINKISTLFGQKQTKIKISKR